MNIWPFSTIKDLRSQVKALEAERNELQIELLDARAQIGAHKAKLDEHKGQFRHIAATLALRGLDKVVLVLACMLLASTAWPQGIIRNLWSTNKYDAQNPLVAVTTLTVSNVNSSWTVQPTGTNTLFIGIQTNTYGGLYTNHYQIQTIDMTGTRTMFGLFSGQYILTNNIGAQGIGDDSTYFGFSAGFSELGTYQSFNTAVGAYALSTMTNGAGNTAIGQKAMTQGTNCQSATAIGAKALAQRDAPARDTAIGYAAMQFSRNGDSAGFNTGGNNTAIGYNAGQYDSGFNNTWIGANAGPNQGSLQSPQHATGIGVNALSSAQNAAFGDLAIGENALQNLQSISSVTAIGYQAMQAGSSYGATAIGYNAGQNASGCNGSIFIGGDAGVNCTTRSTAIFGGNDGNEFITNVVFGADQASANASAWGTLVLQTSGGSGANNAGMGLQIAAGPGTGNTRGGNLSFAIALAGTSGSTQNAYTNAADISSANGVLSARIGLASYATNINSGFSSSATGCTNTSAATEMFDVTCSGATIVQYINTGIPWTTNSFAAAALIILQPNGFWTNNGTVTIKGERAW